jgi:hypothetical protein
MNIVINVRRKKKEEVMNDKIGDSSSIDKCGSSNRRT